MVVVEVNLKRKEVEKREDCWWWSAVGGEDN